MKFYALLMTLIMLAANFSSITVASFLVKSLSIQNTGRIVTVLPLHVEGRFIKDSKGNIIQLRGINKHGFEAFPEGCWQTPEGNLIFGVWDARVVAANLDAIKSWGLNTVRSYTTAEFWIKNTGNHRHIIKQFAELLAARNMYLIYTFWRADDESNQQFPFPSNTLPDRTAFVDLWRSVASELKNYPNVIFSLWNEPNIGNLTDWDLAVQECINAIRETGATNLIIVQRDAFGYNLNEPLPLKNQPPASGATMWWVEGKNWTDPLGNLLYEFHVYRGGIHKFINGTRIDCWEYDDLKIGYGNYCLIDYVLNILNKPVICGEIGPNMWWTGEELQRELAFYNNSLTIFNEWKISYLGFWWWPTWKHAHLINGPNYQPNQAGEILKSSTKH
ncbi:MAG: cellulase family glycosylhydrolase [Candidatus Aenigmatarchaeota archaeon]